jgi:hypothetical protein
MQLRRISIKNFRGIKDLTWALPTGKIFCLIGRGDSAKTTILDAVRFAFHPQWNLSIHDSDFHFCETANPIRIEVVFGDLPEEFFSDQKYGNHLRGWDAANSILHDEPHDDDEEVLSVLFTVAKDLEPSWHIITERHPEGVQFKSTDRAKLNVGLIGSFSDRQLTWASGSALARITEEKDLGGALVDAGRAARTSLNDQRHVALKSFDEAATKSQRVAVALGVPVHAEYVSHLDLAAVSIKVGGLALHDGDLPTRQLGLGSRRMLLCGIQKENLENSHVTLFDEIEIGLEPHRIARLVKHIKADETGQYFLTSHSPSVLRELNAEHLYITHRNGGDVEILSTSEKGLTELNIQGQLRSSAEAFLSLKVLVCEGATEVGFVRGLDDYWISLGRDPMAYLGAVPLDAKGASKIKALAKGFKALHYQTAAIADADAPKDFSPKDEEELNAAGVSVVVWSGGLALEQRAMLDLPWRSVLDSVRLALKEGVPAIDNIKSKLNGPLDEALEAWVDSIPLRTAIGNAAKSSAWFKSTSGGESWVAVIAKDLNDIQFLKTDLGIKLAGLEKWMRDV